MDTTSAATSINSIAKHSVASFCSNDAPSHHPPGFNVKRRSSSILLGLFSNSQSSSSMSSTSQGKRISPASQDARLKNDMLALLESSQSADTCFVVGTDKVEFKAHRLILVARCEYFRQYFESHFTDPPSKSKTEFPFLDPDAFRIVLRFLYTAQDEDEATTTSTNDWRLVLACYQVCSHLLLVERASVYLRVFVALFQRYAESSASSNDADAIEDAADMWACIVNLRVEEMLVSCAPSFWILFGESSASTMRLSSAAHGARTIGSARRLLMDLPLDTLIRVVNAIPENLESALGRFRLVKSWVLSQQPLSLQQSPLSMEDVAAQEQEELEAGHSTKEDPMSPPRTPKTPTLGRLGTPTSPTVLSPLGNERFAALPQEEIRKQLIQLNLAGLTASQILREVEPSGIFSTGHILSLYRSAAASSSPASSSGAASASAWAPVPCGFRGRRPSSWNSRTKWVTIGGANGASGVTVTYCTMEALGMFGGPVGVGVSASGGGRYTWTVMPLQGVQGIGIGVSADVGVSGGGGSGGEDILERIEHGVSSLFGGGSTQGSRRGSLAEAVEEDLDALLPSSRIRASSVMTTTSRFVGDDGGWSLWSDGTLRVGRVFVGRLPNGITFSRGAQISVQLDLDARTLAFEVNGVECGIAFRNLPAVLYPSVVIKDAASVSVSPIKRVF